PGANSLKVAEGVRAAMAGMQKDMLRNGIDYFVNFDATEFVEVSIDEVIETLVVAVFLVICTVYVFLQDWRAALIPTLTIPVSLIGAFFFMMLFGFSINTLTLFGLILVIGIVVDDSIVVVENTQRIIDEERIDSKDAAHKSMDQVAGPVIATALVLMSVFIPTAMIGGIVGQIYKQFALTIAAAVGISGVCAMTLSPALCAIFLRPSIDPHKKFFGFRIFNFCFDSLAAAYLFLVKRLIYASIIVFILWFALIWGLYEAFKVLPSGFLPDEDQGVVFLDVKLPDGYAKDQTYEVMQEIQQIVAESTDAVGHTMFITGYSMMDGGSSSNSGLGVITLKPWGERKTPETSVDGLLQMFQEKFANYSKARVFVFAPPPIMGLDAAGGLALQLLDKRPYGSQVLAETAQDVIDRAKAKDPSSPDAVIVAGMCSFSTKYPRFYLDINRQKVFINNISLSEVFASLQAYFGSAYVNDFNAFNRVYRVMTLAEGDFRVDADEILNYRVKNKDGKMVPFSSFSTVDLDVGPQMLTRFNLYPSASIRLIKRPDKTSGQGMALAEQICESLPDGFGYDWSGMSYQEKNVGSSTAIVFALSIIFGFLVLAAQYESWSTPVIIMMAVPLGVSGALAGVVFRAVLTGTMPEINIYTQIGLVLMVGLSAKNAILITEFARDKRREGEGIIQSAYEAGRLRLRPIMMTSYAFILGVLPLVFAKGAGAAGRRAIGTAVCGGMLTETMVGIFVTPVLFVLLQTMSEWTEKRINEFLSNGKNK
ncbi:MAG: efflux RND transporter permease subunit, partial [Thermoguttaceae bacterium]